MAAHAKLSASGSAIWMNCPGSVKAQEPFPNTSSIYAEEGTLAHSLAEVALESGLSAKDAADQMLDNEIPDDMPAFVQRYIDYIENLNTDPDYEMYIEQRVEFTQWVPKGFGTVDCVLANFETGDLHIVDLKYGQGVQVEAVDNTQLALYALGTLQTLDMGEIQKVTMHIVMPRKHTPDPWEISVKDLMVIGEKFKAKAKEALKPDAPRVAGEKQCQWCRAQATCPALKSRMEETIGSQFDDLDPPVTLSDRELRVVLENKNLIEKYLTSVETYVSDRLHSGETFDGFKLVEGKSVRKWSDDAETYLVGALGDAAYEKKLLTITQAGKLIDKKQLDQITVKPRGKSQLAPASDKRPAIDVAAGFETL
jgi:hypothetical protein